MSKGLRRVILTLGERGALLANRDGMDLVPPFEVKAIDSTGAGDAFIGSFAVFLGEGYDERDAIARANLYAAISTTSIGTQKSFIKRRRFEREWRPPIRQQGGKGPATFDFLGFTLYWRRARSGRWGMWCKTRSSRLQRAINVAADWCRRHRHEPVAVQHAALTRRIRGHFNYFGVSGNYRSLVSLVEATERNWFKWLCRRSNRSRLTWPRFAAILQRFPLPTPRIRVRIWGS